MSLHGAPSWPRSVDTVRILPFVPCGVAGSKRRHVGSRPDHLVASLRKYFDEGLFVGVVNRLKGLDHFRIGFGGLELVRDGGEFTLGRLPAKLDEYLIRVRIHRMIGDFTEVVHDISSYTATGEEPYGRFCVAGSEICENPIGTDTGRTREEKCI